jgi:hypothetical protein
MRDFALPILAAANAAMSPGTHATTTTTSSAPRTVSLSTMASQVRERIDVAPPSTVYGVHGEVGAIEGYQPKTEAKSKGVTMSGSLPKRKPKKASSDTKSSSTTTENALGADIVSNVDALFQSTARVPNELDSDEPETTPAVVTPPPPAKSSKLNKSRSSNLGVSRDGDSDMSSFGSVMPLSPEDALQFLSSTPSIPLFNPSSSSSSKPLTLSDAEIAALPESELVDYLIRVALDEKSRDPTSVSSSSSSTIETKAPTDGSSGSDAPTKRRGAPSHWRQTNAQRRAAVTATTSGGTTDVPSSTTPTSDSKAATSATTPATKTPTVVPPTKSSSNRRSGGAPKSVPLTDEPIQKPLKVSRADLASYLSPWAHINS